MSLSQTIHFNFRFVWDTSSSASGLLRVMPLCLWILSKGQVKGCWPILHQRYGGPIKAHSEEFLRFSGKEENDLCNAYVAQYGFPHRAEPGNIH